jgi:predicted ArsR family transcriptional regulator
MPTEHALVPGGSGSPLRRSRADVLGVLRAEDGPLGIREVATRTGLHQNTARFHLEALVDAGLAARNTENRGTPGRPRIAYRATAGGPSPQRRYRLLAEMLTSMVAAVVPEPSRSAEEAGREWGAYLTEQPAPYQRPSAADAIGKLTAVMAELGFAPAAEAAAGGTRYRLGLRHCPYREVALQHRDVICSLHLGLIRGTLARMRAPVTAESLEPFAEPGVCVAWLAEGEHGMRAAGLPRPDYGASRSSPARTAAWLRSRSLVAVSSVTGPCAASALIRFRACRGPGRVSSAVYRRRNSSNLAGSCWYQIRSSADGATSFAQSSRRTASSRNPRGHSRSTRTRAPSCGSGSS